MLQVKKIETGYGRKQILFGASLEVDKGQIMLLIGPNGAGKSTLLKAVCGLIPTWNGEVQFKGESIHGVTPADTVRKGISFAPQGSRVFPKLTVLENLEIGGYNLPSRELRERLIEVFNLFPILKQRARQHAGNLSGGEQQMLAIARALIPKPQMLLLDEPSLGLSPDNVRMVFDKIVEVNKRTDAAVLMVEQRVKEALRICHAVCSLKLGSVVYSGPPSTLLTDSDKLRNLFL